MSARPVSPRAGLKSTGPPSPKSRASTKPTTPGRELNQSPRRFPTAKTEKEELQKKGNREIQNTAPKLTRPVSPRLATDMTGSRSQALEESKLAAKKKAEARAKYLESEREKERIAQEQRNAAKNLYARKPLSSPPSSEGFFGAALKNFGKKVDEPPPEEEPEPEEPQEPQMTPEEKAAFKKAERKRLRALALAKSLAIAKARYEKTPQGKKVAAAKALRKKKKIAENAAAQQGEEAEVVEGLTEADIATMEEEASYVAVDVAYAASKDVEAKQVCSEMQELASVAENVVTQLEQVSSSSKGKAKGIDNLVVEANTISSNFSSLLEEGLVLYGEVCVSAREAESSSSFILSSKTLEEAMQHVTDSADAAQSTITKFNSLKKLHEKMLNELTKLKEIGSRVTIEYGVSISTEMEAPESLAEASEEQVVIEAAAQDQIEIDSRIDEKAEETESIPLQVDQTQELLPVDSKLALEEVNVTVDSGDVTTVDTENDCTINEDETIHSDALNESNLEKPEITDIEGTDEQYEPRELAEDANHTPFSRSPIQKEYLGDD